MRRLFFILSFTLGILAFALPVSALLIDVSGCPVARPSAQSRDVNS
jgi:hypothetical protein